MKEFDVLTVDGIDLDLVLEVPKLPDEDQKVVGRIINSAPGGPAANFACAASRLGKRVAALAEVGGDQAGQSIIMDFQQYGVDTSLIQIRPDGQTCFTVILVPPSGEKAIVVVPTFNPVYSQALLVKACASAKLVYMMPIDHNHFFKIAEIARVCGTSIMIDVEPGVGSNRTILHRILKAVDIVSFNQQGYEAAFGMHPTLSNARGVLTFGPSMVVVTRGGHGALAVTQHEEATVSGHSVTVVDTTGAGDTFNAAFTAAQELPLAHRLRFANAAAALSTTGFGPRGKLPNVDQVHRFMETVPTKKHEG